MKTIWIFDHYSSEPKYGGYTRQYNIAQHLSQLGYDVTVFASTFAHHTHKFITSEESFLSNLDEHSRYFYFRTAGYENNHTPKRFLGMIQYEKYLTRNYHKLSRKFGIPDFVVGSCPHSFTWSAAQKVAKKANAKFIAEVRDFWPLELRTNNDDLFHKSFYSILQKIEDSSFRNSNLIISTLPYGYKYICDEKGIDKNKVIWIGQPINCNNFDKLSTTKNIPDDINSFIDGKFVCTFAGYYMPFEGVYQMLAAAKEIMSYSSDIVFVFCGSGNEEKGMREYVEKNHLNNVLIHGRIDKEIIPALLKKTNVCMAYVRDDTGNDEFRFGLSKNKVNEYLYSGAVTILGYDHPGNQVEDSKGGFVFNTSENKFAELIKSIYEMSSEDRKEIGENGKRYILNNHDVNVIAKKYLTALEEL